MLTICVPLVQLQLETLLKLFPVVGYRNLALQCLTEVSAFTLQLRDFISEYFSLIHNYNQNRIWLISHVLAGLDLGDSYCAGGCTQFWRLL